MMNFRVYCQQDKKVTRYQLLKLAVTCPGDPDGQPVVTQLYFDLREFVFNADSYEFLV
jgi:hypothetical protein